MPGPGPGPAYSSDILDAIKSFGIRVQLVGFVPTALAIALVTVMVRAGAPTKPLSLSNIDDAVSQLGAAGVTVIVAIAAAASITLAPLQFRLVQWFEGYWPLRPRGAWRLLAPLRPVYRLGLWRQTRRYERTVDALVIDPMGRSLVGSGSGN